MNPSSPRSPRRGLRLLSLLALFLGLTLLSSLMVRSCAHSPAPPRIVPSSP